MRMRVCVTKKDIERGRRQSAVACPIARAVRRHAPKGADVTVTSVGVFVGARLAGVLPVQAGDFVRVFDARGLRAAGFKTPFKFEVRMRVHDG